MFSSALPASGGGPFAALPPDWPPPVPDAFTTAEACRAGHDWGPGGTAETCARCGVHVLDIGLSWARRFARQCPWC